MNKKNIYLMGIALACTSMSMTVQSAAQQKDMFKKLTHPRMGILDRAIRENPTFIDEIIGIKKVAKKIELDIGKVPSSKLNKPSVLTEFVEDSKVQLLMPAKEFLAELYALEAVLKPLIHESLLPLLERGQKPEKDLFLCRFFTVTSDKVETFFYDEITSMTHLKQVVKEFQTLSDDLLHSFTKTTKKAYALWRKEQQSATDSKAAATA